MKNKIITDNNLFVMAANESEMRELGSIPLFLEVNGNLFEINEANLIINEENNNLPLVYFSLKTK